jgi:hypothetical protein
MPAALAGDAQATLQSSTWSTKSPTFWRPRASAPKSDRWRLFPLAVSFPSSPSKRPS